MHNLLLASLPGLKMYSSLPLSCIACGMSARHLQRTKSVLLPPPPHARGQEASHIQLLTIPMQSIPDLKS